MPHASDIIHKECAQRHTFESQTLKPYFRSTIVSNSTGFGHFHMAQNLKNLAKIVAGAACAINPGIHVVPWKEEGRGN